MSTSTFLKQKDAFGRSGPFRPPLKRRAHQSWPPAPSPAAKEKVVPGNLKVV